MFCIHVTPALHKIIDAFSEVEVFRINSACANYRQPRSPHRTNDLDRKFNTFSKAQTPGAVISSDGPRISSLERLFLHIPSHLLMEESSQIHFLSLFYHFSLVLALPSHFLKNWSVFQISMLLIVHSWLIMPHSSSNACIMQYQNVVALFCWKVERTIS